MATTTTTASVKGSTPNGAITTAQVVSVSGMVVGTGLTISGTVTSGGTSTGFFEITAISGLTVSIKSLADYSALTWNTGATVTFVATVPVSLVCTPNALTTAAACFSNQCLGPDDREAIQLMAMFHELAASGGTNYVGNLPQLLKDAASWMVLTEDDRRAIVTYITVANAITAGAGLSFNMNFLRGASKCVLCLPWEQKKNTEMFLKCLLNQLNKPD